MPILSTIRRCLIPCLLAVGGLTASPVQAVPTEGELKTAVETYFSDLFGKLGEAAKQAPTEATFRSVMKSPLDKIDGLYGASLIDANWVIIQVYFKRDFLAVGYSLKKVKELDTFRKLMTETPSPQLSEPGHGTALQPRLISLRYPLLQDGKMTRMVSIMIRTDSFLKAVKLDTCSAYEITCRGQVTEKKGKLSESPQNVILSLPATEWIIRYE